MVEFNISKPIGFYFENIETNDDHLLFICNSTKDQNKISKLKASMIDDYPYEYPTTIDSYTFISKLEGKTSKDEFVYIMKPNKGNKTEFVVVKGIYIDPNLISSDMKEKFEKNVNFIYYLF